jgi:hypothetical protein
MITLTIIFCLTLNDYICRSLPFGHDDYQSITSIEDCMMGGLIGSTTFVKEHAEYFVKGFRCEAAPPRVGEVEDWVAKEKGRLSRAEPQIK